MSTEFALDKSNARLMGVCAGVANWSGIDPLIVRLGVVLSSLFLAPTMILVYLIVGFIAPQR
jgi:phage shock protein C